MVIAKKLYFAVTVRARIWLTPRNVPYGSGNQPYASSRLPTIFPSPKHVNFISVKTNIQHQQPQTYAAAAKAPHTVASVACQSQTNLTWIDSSIPIQRPSLTLSTKSISTKTNSSCQRTPISAFSQPSPDGHSQSAANSASSLLPKIKSTSKTSKSSKPSQPSTSRSKSSSSTSKSSSSPSQHSRGKTDKPANVQSMKLDKSPPTSRPVSVSPRRGRRMSPLKCPS